MFVWNQLTLMEPEPSHKILKFPNDFWPNKTESAFAFGFTKVIFELWLKQLAIWLVCILAVQESCNIRCSMIELIKPFNASNLCHHTPLCVYVSCCRMHWFGMLLKCIPFRLHLLDLSWVCHVRSTERKHICHFATKKGHHRPPLCVLITNSFAKCKTCLRLSTVFPSSVKYPFHPK